mmetsp:Transcript_19318/g.74193  ORF Transcript_19318/g.74193 Transcript_19318/m.74193 type:complete len:356 (+) Transcript_19318:124-1191(+)
MGKAGYEGDGGVLEDPSGLANAGLMVRGALRLGIPLQTSGQQFAFCVAGTFCCYLLQAYLQEYIFSMDGFDFGWFLTWVQFLMYTLFAAVERGMHGESVRTLKAPLRSYILIGVLLVCSMGFANVATSYVGFPTIVLFKSGKLIPVMVGGVLIMKRSYSGLEIGSAFCISGGLVVLTLADMVGSVDYNFTGIVLLLLALMADAMVGNTQEKTMKKYQGNTRELVFFSHLCGSLLILMIMIVNGQLFAALSYCNESPLMYLQLPVFAACGYVGLLFVLPMITIFGSFVAMTVTSCRKAVTLMISFMLFANTFTHMHAVAVALVFGGIALHILAKNRKYLPSWMLSSQQPAYKVSVL